MLTQREDSRDDQKLLETTYVNKLARWQVPQSQPDGPSSIKSSPPPFEIDNYCCVNCKKCENLPSVPSQETILLV